jgi:hypothetical protein
VTARYLIEVSDEDAAVINWMKINRLFITDREPGYSPEILFIEKVEKQEATKKPAPGDVVYFEDDERPWTVAEVDIDIFGAPGLKLRTPWQDIYLACHPTWSRFYAMKPRIEAQ